MNLRNDPDNCELCGKKCPIELGYMATCTNAQCGRGTTAAPGFSECDAAVPGFETCGISCVQGADNSQIPAAQRCPPDRQCVYRGTAPNSHEYASCDSRCDREHADCDGDGTCETRIDVEANCGRCGTHCQHWGSRELCRLNPQGTGYRCQL